MILVNQENFLVKQSSNIERDEINIMNIINDNTFNLHNSLLNNDNMYKRVTNFGCLSRILNRHMAYKTQENLRRYFSNKKCAL